MKKKQIKFYFGSTDMSPNPNKPIKYSIIAPPEIWDHLEEIHNKADQSVIDFANALFDLDNDLKIEFNRILEEISLAE
jgi:hypothetical protein